MSEEGIIAAILIAGMFVTINIIIIFEHIKGDR